MSFDAYDGTRQNGNADQYWMDAHALHPEWGQAQLANHSWAYGRNPYYTQGYDSGYYSAADIIAAVNAGKLDPYTAQIFLSSGGRPYEMSSEQEKAFNNLLARYQSQNALTWQAEQLQALGLSNAGVLQTGAAHTAQDWSNVAQNKYNSRVGMANSLISMAGRMGAAGIHGAALQAVKGAASTAASTVAHTARSAITHYDKNGIMTGRTNIFKYDNYAR